MNWLKKAEHHLLSYTWKWIIIYWFQAELGIHTSVSPHLCFIFLCWPSFSGGLFPCDGKMAKVAFSLHLVTLNRKRPFPDTPSKNPKISLPLTQFRWHIFPLVNSCDCSHLTRHGSPLHCWSQEMKMARLLLWSEGQHKTSWKQILLDLKLISHSYGPAITSLHSCNAMACF